MVAGRQVFQHPSSQGRHDILNKLSAFHRDHDTGMAEVLPDLQAAIGQVPAREHAAEAEPLAEELGKIQEGHRRGPQLLGDILPSCEKWEFCRTLDTSKFQCHSKLGRSNHVPRNFFVAPLVFRPFSDTPVYLSA